ncbi:MAG TPA: hypothetical protein VMU82_09890 [Acetobacteraceae bacterium]|nr:hypothetical protein [Acetobacteraceae bacterium]
MTSMRAVLKIILMAGFVLGLAGCNQSYQPGAAPPYASYGPSGGGSSGGMGGGGNGGGGGGY